jgi:hypothetical protein
MNGFFHGGKQRVGHFAGVRRGRGQLAQASQRGQVARHGFGNGLLGREVRKQQDEALLVFITLIEGGEMPGCAFVKHPGFGLGHFFWHGGCS